MDMHEFHTQHQASATTGRTLEGITSLVSLPNYNQLRAAVAYATLRGCELLTRKARKSSSWKKCRKRWLISIDFGRTEPAALNFLATLPNSEVKIPNGMQVVFRPSFLPVVPFHPKLYAVDDMTDGNSSVFGIFLGSGNLTASGLLTGSESGALLYWVKPSNPQKKRMFAAHEQLAWFEAIWDRADPLANVISDYKKRWKKTKAPISEDSAASVRLYDGEATLLLKVRLRLDSRLQKGSGSR